MGVANYFRKKASSQITFSTTINQDSDLVTVLYISLLPLHVTISVLSMLTLHWKFLAFFLIDLKHLIEFGMMVSFIKPKVTGMTVTSLKLIKSLLNNRCQMVVLNGQSLVSKSVRAGAPQGSVLGPLFFPRSY